MLKNNMIYLELAFRDLKSRSAVESVCYGTCKGVPPYSPTQGPSSAVQSYLRPSSAVQSYAVRVLHP